MCHIICITDLYDYIVLSIFLFFYCTNSGSTSPGREEELLQEKTDMKRCERRVIDLGFDNHSHTKMSQSR